MYQNKENFTGTAFIEPLAENGEPDFVSVIVLQTQNGIDGDALEVTFPSNEHVVFDPRKVGLPDDFYTPESLLTNILIRDWEVDPDVPHMVRFFMLQHEGFLENIDNNYWLLEIDSESNHGQIMTRLHFGNKGDPNEVIDGIEGGFNLKTLH